MRFKNKVALITGAGSGIGKAAAILFAKEGARVALLGRTEEKLKEAVNDIENKKNTLIIAADISNPDEVKNAVKQITDKWGQLDIVFANAGINGVWAPLEDLKPEDWNKTISINLTGTFLTVKYAVPELKKKGGSVIITSSVNGTRMFSNTGASAYASSKAAQAAFAKMTALELAPFKVRVNVICPGAITTDIDEHTEHRNTEKVKTPVEFPEGKIPLTKGNPGTPEQVAQLVLFLSSDEAEHISGTEIWIDGTQSLLQG